MYCISVELDYKKNYRVPLLIENRVYNLKVAKIQLIAWPCVCV